MSLYSPIQSACTSDFVEKFMRFISPSVTSGTTSTMSSTMTDSMSMSLMESSSPEKVIINDYKLAFKFFVNKDFGKSYAIVLKLHDHAYKNFELGTLSEEYFIKIVTLYLTEVGLLINPRDSSNAYALPRAEKKVLMDNLEQGVYLDNLYKTYGDIAKIPLELLFQVFLVNYTCQNLVGKEHPPLAKHFRKVYSLLDFQSNVHDKYLKRWVDMYVFNVLPDAEDFTTAFRIAEENPLVDTAKAKVKLDELEQLKKQEKKVREKKAKELQSMEAKRLEHENATKRKAKDESDLKFKSLKQIRQERERDENKRRQDASPTSASRSFTFDQLKARLEYLINASSKIVQKNSPVILIAIVLTFIVTRFLRTRRINLREKILETLRMAFKVTYL